MNITEFFKMIMEYGDLQGAKEREQTKLWVGKRR